MYPKYENFLEDLNRFNNKITELYYNFKKIKPEDMSEKDRETADSLQYHFNNIQQYIFTLMKDNPGNDYDIEEEKSNTWNHLKREINSIMSLGIINQNHVTDLSEEAVLAEIYDTLGSDHARYMQDIYKQIVLMGSDLEVMNNRGKYYEAYDKVDSYLRLRRQRDEELKEFKQVVPFKDYFDLFDAKNRAFREYSEAKSTYNDYADGKLVAQALEKYNKKKAGFEDIKKGYLGVISVINDQKLELENELKEAHDNLKSEQEALKNYDKTSARYKKKFDELAEKEESLNKEMTGLREAHYKLMEQKNDTLALIDDVDNEFKGYEAGKAKQGEDPNFVAVRKDFVKLLRESSEIKDMRDDLDKQLNAIGYLTRDAKDKIKAFNDGKVLENLDEEILKLYKEKKLKGIFENIDFKNSVQRIYNEMTDKYVAYLKLDENQKKEFYQKVNSLGKLREHMKKHNSRITNDIEAFTAGTYKNNTLNIDKKKMAEYGKPLRELYSKWYEAKQKNAYLETLQEGINYNGEKFSKLEAELREVKDESARQQRLFMGESRPTNIAKYTEAIETLPKKIIEKRKEMVNAERKFLKADSELRAAKSEYSSVVERAENSKERLERSKKVYEALRSQLDKVDHFVDTTKKVEQEGKKLELQLDLDDQMRIQNDFWKSTRKTIDNEIREFLLTANVGKRAGHTNSQEFEQMRSSLFYLSGVKLENKEITNNLTPEEFLKRLVIVKQAAKDYIKAKEDETFAWGTTMRKTRLDYARRLENYANRKLVEITDMMKKNNELNEKIASAKLLEPLYGNNPSKIINEVINKPILARKKVEEEKKLAEQKKKDDLKRQNQQPVKGGPVLA